MQNEVVLPLACLPSMDLWVECVALPLLHVLWVISPVAPRPFKQKHAVFHSGHSLQDVFFTRDLIQDMATSRVGCASHCHMKAMCRSYFYNKRKHRCRSHSVTFSDDTGGIHEEGWEYYGHRGRARKHKKKTSNVITTVAPGLDDTPKFAQNATTPSPATEDEDDEDDSDDFGDNELTQAPSSRSPTAGKTLETKPDPSAVTSTEIQDRMSNGGKTLTDAPSDRVSSDINIGITRTTSSGSRVTIRRTDGKEIPTLTTSSGGDSSTNAESSTKFKSSPSHSKSAQTGGKMSVKTTANGMTAISKADTTEPVLDNTREETTSPEAHDTTGSTTEPGRGEKDSANTNVPHDEELHDQLSFLTTKQQNKVIELSTGIMLPGTDDEDDGEDESVTIVVMMDDDEDEDHGLTSHMVMEKEMDTTVDVITLGDNTQISDGDDDDDDDDDDGFFGLDVLTGFPFTTDLLGLTLGAESQHDQIDNRQRGDNERWVSPVTESDTQPDETQTTQHFSAETVGRWVGEGEGVGRSGDSWVGGGVAALGVLCVGVPLVGLGVYTMYRRRRTGSWTILQRQEDGLGLHLISSQ